MLKNKPALAEDKFSGPIFKSKRWQQSIYPSLIEDPFTVLIGGAREKECHFHRALSSKIEILCQG